MPADSIGYGEYTCNSAAYGIRVVGFTALFHPINWIAKTYWLELEADTEIDLGSCGEISLEFTLLWTESTLGRSHFALSYESTASLSISIEGDIDLEDGEWDQISLTLGTEW